MDSAAKEAFLNGVAKARAGDLAGANALFTEAIDREPGWVQARLNRAVALFLMKDHAAALSDLDLVVASDPKLVDGYLNRSAVRRAAGDAAGADADLAAVGELDPNNPTVLIARATAKLRAGHAAGAEADYTRVLEQQPNMIVARVNRAAARIQTGDLAGAIQDCENSLAVDPKHRDALINRATALLMLGEYAAAAADAETLLEADANAVEGLYIRGVARTGLERFASALADLNEVVKRAPALAAGRIARANVKYHLNDPGAAADYREAFAADPVPSARVVVRLLKDHAKMRPAEVLAECAKYRTRDRSDAISLARRGLTRLIQNRPTDANLDFAAFRKLAPADVHILDALTRALAAPEPGKKPR